MCAASAKPSPRHGESGGQGAYRHVGDAETTMQYMAWEMNESLTGMRVQDVVRSIDYALSRPDVDRAGVRVIGKGMGALWVLFARRPRRARYPGGLRWRAAFLSHAGIVRSLLTWRQHHAARRVEAFRSAASGGRHGGRRLVLLDPVDAMKSRVEPDTVRRLTGRRRRWPLATRTYPWRSSISNCSLRPLYN